MRRNHQDDVRSGGASGTLGTFSGVFTPSVLTILGIVLFLRLGYVVGSAGLATMLVILALATAIVVLTAISLSAVTSNMRVRGGGDYFLISRTLGFEFGGAIGVVLFLAQSVSVAFYCVGFGEAITEMSGAGGGDTARLVALAAVVPLFGLAWLGADWATRFQYGVMAVLVASLASFALGASARWDATVMAANWARPADGPSFWVLFAMFFPAVTGFTQGVSMSGDLRNPGRSITRGTFAAVGLSTVVYAGAAVLFAGALPGDVLRGDYASMRRIARVAWIIDAGVMAAALSSAMASFLGAPRILQSMARDRVFGVLRPFAQGVGSGRNPRRAVALTGGIAVVAIVFGSLDLIAPVVSMFFLTSYGLLNYATYYEARANSPSFRPRFAWFDRRVSLAGGLACLGATLAIDPAAGMLSGALLLALYQYLRRTAGPARWADGSRSYHFQRIREHLFAMAADAEHPRDWRPQLIVFSNHSPRREQLLRFASWIEGGSGLTTVVQILTDGEADLPARRREAEDELRRNVVEAGVQAFPLVIDGPDLRTAGRLLLQSLGMGPIRPNTILLNWRDEGAGVERRAGERRYGHYLKLAVAFGCNVVVLCADDERWQRIEQLSPDERRVDVWWWGDASSRLMLLLAYLMTRIEGPGPARIRVLAGTAADAERTQERLEETLREVRIEAEVVVVPKPDADTIVELSADAALVFLPIRLRGEVPCDPFGGPLDAVLGRLPVTACVIAARDIQLDAEPDEGTAAALAAAVDARDAAERELHRAEKAAAELADIAATRQRSLVELATDSPPAEHVESEQAAAEAADAAKEAAAGLRRARDDAKVTAARAEALGAPASAAADEADDGDPDATARVEK